MVNVTLHILYTEVNQFRNVIDAHDRPAVRFRRFNHLRHRNQKKTRSRADVQRAVTRLELGAEALAWVYRYFS